MKKRLLFPVLLLIMSASASAQSYCGNQDFDDALFTNWSGATGMNPGSFLTPNSSWANGIVSTGPDASIFDVANRMTIITVSYLDSMCIDPVTQQLDTQMTTLAPGGGSASVRLGNANMGFECEKLVYQFTVSAQDPWFQFQFATVMEDPGHNYDAQPFFMLNIYDQSMNVLPCCSDTIWSADPSYPFIATTSPYGNFIQYRRWTPVSVDLTGLVGQTVTVEFINSDCGFGGHFGYTYIDVSCFGGPVANVWPGDTDYDLQANNFDLVPLAIALGANGTSRAGASNNWVAQASTDWSQGFAFGLNYKHSDCNGDGVVDLNDTLAIALNYNQVHPFRYAGPNVDPLTLPSLYFVPVNDTVGPFSYVDVDMYIGTQQIPVHDLAGLSFDLTYDNALVQAGTFSADFSVSLFGTKNVDMLTLAHDNWSNGRTGMALAKTQGAEIDGMGYIGRARLAVGGVSAATQLELGIANLHAVSALITDVPMNGTGCSIVIDPALPANVQQENTETNFVFYPNPANGSITVNTASGAQTITITDALGREVFRTQVSSAQTQISLEGFAPGMYFLNVGSAKGNSTQVLSVN